MSDQNQHPKPQDTPAPQLRDEEQLKPTPVDPKKDDRGGLSTGVDTGAIQPGKTGNARI